VGTLTTGPIARLTALRRSAVFVSEMTSLWSMRNVGNRGSDAAEDIVVGSKFDPGVAEDHHHSAARHEFLQQRQLRRAGRGRRFADDVDRGDFQRTRGHRRIAVHPMSGGGHRRLDFGHVGVVPRSTALVPVTDDGRVGIAGDPEGHREQQQKRGAEAT